mgnify:CR=1 FL=1|jgi:large subunit ribosomal protein L30
MARTIKDKSLRITLVKSPLGYSKRHKGTIRALGLRRLQQTVEHVDSPQLRGMLDKVSHLLDIVDG